MKLRQLIIAAFTLSSAVAFAHGTAAKTTSDNSGANITQVQQALNDKGFDAGPVDGKAGPKTKAALKQFQQSQGSSSPSSDTSMSSSPSTSQGASSIGSSQPPSSAPPSSNQASNQQQSSAPSQSSTTKY